MSNSICMVSGFNTQPPEGGWTQRYRRCNSIMSVSTHSRPKAAGLKQGQISVVADVSTHSRPKAAGSDSSGAQPRNIVSTHSRPKAAGRRFCRGCLKISVSTHSRPKAAGEQMGYNSNTDVWFQHTAARRRLGHHIKKVQFQKQFQHTAARRRLGRWDTTVIQAFGFNTQPPEGGWFFVYSSLKD